MPLYSLALLACPIGMGLMMWLMTRGPRPTTPPPAAPTATDLEVVRLRAEVDQLHATHRDTTNRDTAAEPATPTAQYADGPDNHR
jgi:hypothetical protein